MKNDSQFYYKTTLKIRTSNKIILLGALLSLLLTAGAQDKKKGEMILSVSAGPGFSNFYNSEAPHKINIFGSDIHYIAVPTSDVTKLAAYTEYNPNIFNDILFGFSTGIQLEYFVWDNLSLFSGLCFEMKGKNLNNSSTTDGVIMTNEGYYRGVINESFHSEVTNDYITLPILARKYFTKNKNFFIEGGIYGGYLVLSKLTYTIDKTVTDNNIEIYHAKSWINNAKDDQRYYTNHFDFGFSAGTCFTQNLTSRLIFLSELRFNIGVIKLDRKYSNEFEMLPHPQGTNLSGYLLRSTNYFGFNSNSRNINLTLTVGVGYRIGK